MPTLSLSIRPGFADLPNTAISAGDTAYGLHLMRIAANAAFGMCRVEVFTANYHDGDTVALPISKIDGYSYSREELTYVWSIQNTVDPNTGWLSGPDSLYFCAWLVEQASGNVSCREWYRRSGDHDETALSRDGILQVHTIGQRQKTNLIVSSPLNAYTDVGMGALAVNAPYTQDVAQQLNDNAKFSALNLEVFYMGEFHGGQTVGTPISPVDGYHYTRAETTLVYSWRWTTTGTAFNIPDRSLGQMGPIQASIDQATGDVSTTVFFYVPDDTLTSHTDYGRLAVFAIGHRHDLIDSIPTVADQFAEQDYHTYLLGSSLRASTMQQLNQNVREAACSPEVFGPALYKNGDTIPVPVSPIDGYIYSRSELFFLWEWADTTMETGTHLRCPVFLLKTSQLPTIDLEVWRLPPGGPWQLGNLAYPRVVVTTLAIRLNNEESSPADGGGGNPPPNPGPFDSDGSSSGGQQTPYTVAAMLNCLVNALQVVVRHVFATPVSFFPNMGFSQAWLDTPPTSPQVFTLWKFPQASPTVGTPFGTLTFNPGAYYGTFSASAIDFAIGDVLELIGPDTVGDGAGMSFSFSGQQDLIAPIQSLNLIPPSGTIAVGASQAIQVIATLTDGTTSDVTDQIIWSTSDGSVATVTGEGTSTVTVNGIANGSATITGTLGSQSVAATYGVGTGSGASTEDLLNWVSMDSRASTEHLSSPGHSVYSYLDSSNHQFWWIKGSGGNPWDIRPYDSVNIYWWITENGSAGFTNPNGYKRYISPVPLMPRDFKPGTTVTIDTPGPNTVVPTMACETDGLPTITIGDIRGKTYGPVSMIWGGDVGTKQTIIVEYYYSGHSGTYNDRERYFLVKDWGLVQWDHYTLKGGSYVFVQQSLFNTLTSGGTPAPNFPCGLPSYGLTSNPGVVT